MAAALVANGDAGFIGKSVETFEQFFD